MFQGVFKSVSRLLQEGLKNDSTRFQGCFMGVSGKFQENLKGERMCQVCFKEVSEVC